MDTTAEVQSLPLTRESRVLILICLADLFATLTLLSRGHVVEGNPIMSFYLGFGIWAFVTMKLALVFLPVFVAEWSKRFRPRFVRLMLRGAIGAYLGIYLVMFVSVNVMPNSSAHLVTDPPVVTSTRLEK